MELRRRTVALYGRFSNGMRDRLAREIALAGGSATRDLTRRSDYLVIGAQAAGLVQSGALAARLDAAQAMRIPIYGEKGFARALAAGYVEGAPTYPLAAALTSCALDRADAEILAAFDLIAIAQGACRFGDVAVMRTASELAKAGFALADVVRILMRARDQAPTGRRRIVRAPSGEAALLWDDGLTTLDGQGYLPLDEDAASVDDLFEAAMLAEAEGDFAEAARLYDMSARADRRDAIAPYNCGNLHLRQGRYAEAALAYQRALARDGGFVEARYNLAQALEALGKAEAAAAELERVMIDDPTHGDAVFNLAQLRMQRGLLKEAKALYERYLAQNPPPDWADKARKALLYCTARLSA